jgi:hypothetical protein
MQDWGSRLSEEELGKMAKDEGLVSDNGLASEKQLEETKGGWFGRASVKSCTRWERGCMDKEGMGVVEYYIDMGEWM